MNQKRCRPAGRRRIPSNILRIVWKANMSIAFHKLCMYAMRIYRTRLLLILLAGLLCVVVFDSRYYSVHSSVVFFFSPFLTLVSTENDADLRPFNIPFRFQRRRIRAHAFLFTEKPAELSQLGYRSIKRTTYLFVRVILPNTDVK